MDLLKMVQKSIQLKEEARQTEANLREILRNLFVELQFEVCQKGLQEETFSGSRQVKVYYPVLEVPKGFVKVDEKYVQKYANSWNHIYTLKGENGIKVDIDEDAIYRCYISNFNGQIRLPGNIVEYVTYKITISGETYKFEREFEYEDMLYRISKGKVGRASISRKDSCRYTLVNKTYENFIRILGAEEPIVSLGKIVTSKINEVKLNSHLVAKYEFKNRVIKEFYKYKSSIWSFGFKEVLVVETLVKVKIYYQGDKLLEEKKFKWMEIKEPKFRKGVAFKEALELIKE